ncbi:zinc ribbon domain-containing protein [Pseudonocardia sp. DR1-2]|uniref:FmdB family zinc ribbon protein n=1 Tax=Pseudonocardia sp. DR1-2 TaxID=2951168 RepID=UPI0020431D20|nr:FmdB family zinc ribbon protein [Pseudonocardia sp. DR1-2]MCM3847705.1 zinc ribbon domain-containing protein [Pseudonocardia sp. DR1-2]
MATYSYRCRVHGEFDARLPLGAAPGSRGCPVCGTQAPRRWSGVALLGRGPAVALVDRCERSRTEPEVVTSIPARPRTARRPAPSAAAHRLPRP